MEVLKFVLIGIVGAIIYVFLKKENSEIATLSLVATSLVIIILLIDYAVQVLNIFKELSNKTGVSSQVFTVIVKTIIIAYITEFTKSFCDDVGVSSVGNKVLLAGKISIFIIIAPLLFSITTLLLSLIK